MYANETSADMPRFSVEEKIAGLGWCAVKVFAQKANADHFASTLAGAVRVMPIEAPVIRKIIR